MNRENKRKTFEKGYYKTNPCHASFTCKVCGRLVMPEGAGSSHRNHCPNCLSSLHIDVEPGDRERDCGGIMESVAVWVQFISGLFVMRLKGNVVRLGSCLRFLQRVNFIEVNAGIFLHGVHYSDALKRLVFFLTDAVACDIGLNVTLQILNVAARSLSHDSFGHHAAGNGHRFALQRIKAFLDFIAVMCHIVFGYLIHVCFLPH